MYSENVEADLLDIANIVRNVLNRILAMSAKTQHYAVMKHLMRGEDSEALRHDEVSPKLRESREQMRGVCASGLTSTSSPSPISLWYSAGGGNRTSLKGNCLSGCQLWRDGRQNTNTSKSTKCNAGNMDKHIKRYNEKKNENGSLNLIRKFKDLSVDREQLCSLYDVL